MIERPVVALAGAGGDLGSRIAKALVARGADVRALVRPDGAADASTRIESLGATVVAADPADVDAMAQALQGVTCTVSALNGLRDVMIDRQGVLLDASVRAGVPRFVPSDYAIDFTTTRPGDNRNLDLRREFMHRVDAAPVRASSVLNGALMELLGAEIPLIRPRFRRVLYWHDADQPLDFTAKDDVAACTAAVALDRSAPRLVRVAGDSASARDIALAMQELVGQRYRTQWVGSLGMIGAMIGAAKLFAPGKGELFPAWQGLQYVRDQFGGRAKLEPLDNDRYPDLTWTSIPTYLSSRFVAGTASTT